MNNIRGGRVTCYMDEIQLLRSFGERQPKPMPLAYRMSFVMSQTRINEVFVRDKYSGFSLEREQKYQKSH
jgi:hypothetical protein